MLCVEPAYDGTVLQLPPLTCLVETSHGTYASNRELIAGAIDPSTHAAAQNGIHAKLVSV